MSERYTITIVIAHDNFYEETFDTWPQVNVLEHGNGVEIRGAVKRIIVFATNVIAVIIKASTS